MPNTITHSPADLVRRVLIDLSLGTLPSNNGTWPIHAGTEPDSPDNVTTLYDTAGQGDGRSMVDGELFQHYGFQVRVRAVDHNTGWAKTDAIRNGLAKSVYQRTVTISGVAYAVHAATKIGQVLPLGFESPQSKRCLFTLNALLVVRQK